MSYRDLRQTSYQLSITTILIVALLVSLVPVTIFSLRVAAVDCSESARAIRMELQATNNIPSFADPCDTGCGGGGSGTSGTTAASLPGNTTEEKVWNYFKAKGLTAEQIAGVMGNIEHESHFDAAAIEGSGGGGFGIVQWTGGRRTAIESAAAAAGRNASDLGFQLDYLFDELNSRNQWQGLTQQATAQDALVYFHNEFEISFLSNFSDPGYTDHRTNPPYIAYGSVRAAVLGERGGFDTPDHKTGNGSRGAAWFLQELGGISGGGGGSSQCSTTGGVPIGQGVHPTGGTAASEGYGGPRSFGSVTCKGMIWHNGYDLQGERGVTPVFAVLGGTVSGPSGYNNTVRITHDGGFATEYLHMDSGNIKVKEGDVVNAGDQIGTVGNTGFSSGAHLHFQVDVGGNTNPDVAKLPVVDCGGAYTNPAAFMRLFKVELCQTGTCDNPVTS